MVMLFILYIVFILLKLNEVVVWLKDLVIPSLAFDRFSSDLICLSVELMKSMVYFRLDLFASNMNRRFFMLNLEHDHVLWNGVRQHRYSNRGRTPSVTTHITRSKINTPMFSRGKTPTGKHPRPQPTRPLGAVY
jgi:hypothetical protein